MTDLTSLPNFVAPPRPRVSNLERKSFFNKAPSKTTYLPPSLPSEPFKLDVTMFIISSAGPDSVRKTSSSSEFREYIALRKLLLRLESELVIAQTYVDAETKAYYSNIKNSSEINIQDIFAADFDHVSFLQSVKKFQEGSAALHENSTILQESSTVRHLRAVEEHFYSAQMKYLLLSVAILRKLSPSLSSTHSTMSLPSTSLSSTQFRSRSPTSTRVRSPSPISTQLRSRPPSSRLRSSPPSSRLRSSPLNSRLRSSSPNSTQVSSRTRLPSPSRSSRRYTHSTFNSASPVYSIDPPPYWFEDNLEGSAESSSESARQNTIK